MKKIIATLIVLFIAINIMAQEHLTFKGIPIEGSMTEFCQKLKTNSFHKSLKNYPKNIKRGLTKIYSRS